MSNAQPTERPDWDTYFMRMAHVAKQRSKDTKTGDHRVGAVLVGPERVVVTTAYNGPARGLLDLPERLLDRSEKLRWMCHAEMNAVFNAARMGTLTKGSTIYVTKFPCVTCAGAIAQAGVGRVYTDDDEMWEHDPNGDDGRRSLAVFREVGITVHAPRLPLEYIHGLGGKKEEPAQAAEARGPSSPTGPRGNGGEETGDDAR